jgi:hypothetical protein
MRACRVDEQTVGIGGRLIDFFSTADWKRKIEYTLARHISWLALDKVEPSERDLGVICIEPFLEGSLSVQSNPANTMPKQHLTRSTHAWSSQKGIWPVDSDSQGQMDSRGDQYWNRRTSVTVDIDAWMSTSKLRGPCVAAILVGLQKQCCLKPWT